MNNTNTNPETRPETPSPSELQNTQHAAKEDMANLMSTILSHIKKSVSFGVHVAKNPFAALLQQHHLTLAETATHYGILAGLVVILQTVLSLTFWALQIHLQSAISGAISIGLQITAVYFLLDHFNKKTSVNELAEIWLIAWIPCMAIQAGVAILQRISGFMFYGLFSLVSIAVAGFFAFLIYFAFKRRLSIQPKLASQITLGLFVISFLMMGGFTTLQMLGSR